MLALARRSVVQDRVDVLLKIGLGPMGKVSPISYLKCTLLTARAALHFRPT